MEQADHQPVDLAGPAGLLPGRPGHEPRQTLYAAGQGPWTPRATWSTTATCRTGAQAMDNVETVLAAAGMTLADVVRYDIHATDLQDYFRAGPRAGREGVRPGRALPRRRHRHPGPGPRRTRHGGRDHRDRLPLRPQPR